MSTSDVKSGEYDVAIVGGGMVGLCLAQMLAQALPTQRLAVIDSYAPSAPSSGFRTSFDAKTTAIASQSVDILRKMMIWDRLSEHATGISQVHVSNRGYAGRVTYTAEENSGEALGFVLENAWLGQCLTQVVVANEAIDCWWGADLEDVSIDASAARLSIDRDGQKCQLACKLLIVADGAESRTRDKLGIAADVHDYRQSAVIANVEYECSHRGLAFERFTDQGPLALLPLGESPDARRSSLVWTLPTELAQEASQWHEHKFLSCLQDRFGFRLGKFLRLSQRHIYPLKRVLAREQARSSVVIMGNAAHFLHPVAGQGFNLALRDASALASILGVAQREDRSLSAYSTLSQYVDCRYWDQWATLSLSHQFNELFRNKHRSAKALTNVGLLAINAHSSLKKRFFGQMMGRGSFAR